MQQSLTTGVSVVEGLFAASGRNMHYTFIVFVNDSEVVSVFISKLIVRGGGLKAL